MRRGPVIAFALSSVVSTVGAVLFFKMYVAHNHGGSVRFVETRAEIDALLRSGTAAGAPGYPRADGGLRRRPLLESEALAFFPSLKSPSPFLFDEVAYMTLRPGNVLTRKWPEHPNGKYQRVVNAQGFSREGPISGVQPSLRVLVVGDSHLQGVVSTSENLCAVMEAELALVRPGETVEVLNAGQGGTSFYNYLAVVERYLELKPNVVVCLAYTGNDFGGAIELRRMFEAITIEHWNAVSDQRTRALRQSKLPGLGQCLHQALSLMDNPETEAIGVDAGCEVMVELAQTCEAHGIGFVCVRLPSAFVAQPDRYKSHIEDGVATVKLGDAPFEVEPRISLEWMTRLAGRGVEVVDLAPSFASIDRDLYWHRDLHLSVEGHRAAAEVLVRHVKLRLE